MGSRKTVGQLRQEHVAKALRKRDDYDPNLLYPTYNISAPVDYFHNESKYEPHSDETFPLRYWFDATHYKPGGPVIVLQSGETDGTNRLPYLQKGILHQLAETTHGIGVVLEHRYYGESWPTDDLSTESLRFLTTQQALADQAYFAKNVRFPGLEEHGDLSPHTTAWLAYGGSYAGAFVAFLRVLYPDVYFGAISSSGVTKAIYDYWEYFSPIAEHAPSACVASQRLLTNVVDNILLGEDDSTKQSLKKAFGMGNLTHNDDFANQLSYGITGWQSLNWDPAVGANDFYEYCDNITSIKLIYPDTSSLRSTAASLVEKSGYGHNRTLTTQLLNYIGYMNLTAVAPCTESGATQDECFTVHNATFYEQDGLDQTWRSWPYQYCSEWGYLQTGSGVPEDELPLISRLIDIEYSSIVCRDAFNITEPSDVEVINQYGGYDISYPRLAIVDGDWDPWKPATPHAFEQGAKQRTSTASKPFILIDAAVHHWDENGLFPNQTTADLPPSRIRDSQAIEAMFVQEWMAEWQLECLSTSSCKGLRAFVKDLKA
ncbi:serine carboxypeptidase [Polychaeton citri CBS 116435]|uniref:Serine carboxypeptidase n=1 Tax=Polychaeton citri CBS 116435 TaxID=1314669 RepID=A0A9P4UT64_9PEZI|nr:serine carboxypeptidase [Polychaeton citri CBS 116435]